MPLLSENSIEPESWQILVAAMAGWITRQQDAVIDYLREENRVLKHSRPAA